MLYYYMTLANKIFLRSLTLEERGDLANPQRPLLTPDDLF